MKSKNKSFLKADNIFKSFGKKKVLDNCSIKIDYGTIVGLLGSNGSGKTTFLKIFLGLLKADSGRIINLDGEFIATKEAFGIIETPVFYESLTGIENVEYFCEPSSYDLERLMYFANEFKLSETDLNNRVSKYSLGMKQKLALLLTLLSQRPLLVLDEPTNSLDYLSCITFIKLLKEKVNTQNTSVIISSHNMGEIQKLCDVVYIINEGKIVDNRDIKFADSEIIYEFQFLDADSCTSAIEVIPFLDSEINGNKMTVRFLDISYVSSTIEKMAGYGLIEAKRTDVSVSEFYNQVLRKPDSVSTEEISDEG